jgi:deazaflavin-dependent oxidoreductase (nitroreductase family)
MGTIFLHTVGRKTGEPRVNPLFAMADGSDLVVVASNAGAATDPAWWLNLRAEPNAEVEVRRVRRPVHAREATVDEASKLWPRVIAMNPDYADYRRTARRPIPIVILEAR